MRFLLLILAACVGACAIFGADERAQLSGTMNAVEQCQEQARRASIGCLAEGGDTDECDPKAIATYRACKADGGL